jgi:hypothetical protein
MASNLRVLPETAAPSFEKGNLHCGLLNRSATAPFPSGEGAVWFPISKGSMEIVMFENVILHLGLMPDAGSFGWS